MFAAIITVVNCIIHLICPFGTGLNFLRIVRKHKAYCTRFKSGANIIVRIAGVVVVRIAIVVDIAEVSRRRYQAEPLFITPFSGVCYRFASILLINELRARCFPAPAQACLSPAGICSEHTAIPDINHNSSL